MKWLRESALHYQLSGRPLGELCEYNALVASELGRQEVAQTWKVLKVLYGSGQPGGSADFLAPDLLESSVRVDGDRSKCPKALFVLRGGRGSSAIEISFKFIS